MLFALVGRTFGVLGLVLLVVVVVEVVVVLLLVVVVGVRSSVEGLSVAFGLKPLLTVITKGHVRLFGFGGGFGP